MDFHTQFMNITSPMIVGMAGALFTYLLLKYYTKRPREASDAFNYLSVKVVTTEIDCDEVVCEIKRRCKFHKTVGFDCEWVTNNGKRGPVALIQLSTADGYCALFRLCHLKDVPTSLKELLEDETIYKVGVAPLGDAQYLHRDYNVLMKSTLDLRYIAVMCGHSPGGLASLSKVVLNVILDKSWRIRCSDWEAETLSERQINYAAADAHVAIKIFVNLMNKFDKRRFWSMLYGGKGNNVWGCLNKLCWQYVDVGFKGKSNAKTGTGRNDNSKTQKESKRYPHSTRSKPLYHNCFLEAPDGELLCTIDNKKAMWYVSKEIAQVVKEEPLTVRLSFEPSGRSVGDVGRYYQLTKENKCVVCGATNSYIRKNVVPREYRKHFPEIMKEHSSHDVLLLCVGCHQRSNIGDKAVRERLANMCAAPLGEQIKYIEDQESRSIRSAARTLLYQTKKHVLPEWRRKELEAVILRYYNKEQLTDELLEEAAKLQIIYENSDYESHGLKVVEYFLEKGGGLLKLEEIWREHFLTSMQPNYMPALWSIKHNEERLRVRLQEGRLNEQDLKSIGISKSSLR